MPEFEDWKDRFGRLPDDDLRQTRELFPRVYEEIRGLAHRALMKERRSPTFGVSDLVQEVYLKLSEEATWENRRHFFGAVGRAMRCVLIDRVRRKKRKKHGEGLKRVPMEAVENSRSEVPDPHISSLLFRLEELAEKDSARAAIATFSGLMKMDIEQIADLLDETVEEIERDIRALQDELEDVP